MLNVADIMTREPYTLGPDDSLTDARNLMAQHHVRHVPVVSSEGTILGLVSHRDVLAASDSSVLSPGEAGKEAYVALSSIMTSPVKTVDERDSLRGTALRMQQERIGCLPVTRKGDLVGIVSDSDFVAVAVHLMEQLELSEPEEDL
jgi:CBS domain-containing protein